ncbi:MAG TPA: hypothetical protein VID73_12690 [Ktedonobacterales bacterium]|jgi:hypothetical protein
MDAPLTSLIVDGATAGLCALALLAEARALGVAARRVRLARWLAIPPLLVAALAGIASVLAWGLWAVLLPVWPPKAIVSIAGGTRAPLAWELSMTSILNVAVPITLGGTALVLLAGLTALFLAPGTEGSGKSGLRV